MGSYCTLFGLSAAQTHEKITTCISSRKLGVPRYQRDIPDFSKYLRPEILNAFKRSLIERGVIIEAAKNVL